MKTYSFIGPDKNSGKTTVFNYIYKKFTGEKRPITITSIGINGEGVDHFNTQKKPLIRVKKNTLFVTNESHLKLHQGKFKVITIFPPPFFSKSFVLGECLQPFNMILEGPNSKDQLIRLKEIVYSQRKDGVLLIDGSIDRQFIADPKITDEFYFALPLTNNFKLNSKIDSIITSLSYKTCNRSIKEIITHNKDNQTKSLILKNKKVIFKGVDIPSGDKKLHDVLNNEEDISIYINGALTPLLANQIKNKSTEIILDNFTLNHLTMESNLLKRSKYNISLLNKIIINRFFIKDDGGVVPSNLPKGIPVHNLYREDIDGN